MSLEDCVRAHQPCQANPGLLVRSIGSRTNFRANSHSCAPDKKEWSDVAVQAAAPSAEEARESARAPKPAVHTARSRAARRTRCFAATRRSEERRVGKECRCRWAAYG